MANYCYTVPILPGGEEMMQNWIQNNIIDNPDHDRVFHKAGVYSEQVWIQRTPMGDFAVVCFGTDDPAESFRKLATSTDPWAEKFRQLLQSAHGVDVSKPVPINQQVLDWAETERNRIMENKNAVK
jgi:hypothetical protein